LALLLWLLVQKTRMGRAGARRRLEPRHGDRHGHRHQRLFTIVFGIGAMLCAVAGALLGPLLAVQVGMGENILILAFVVIVIGGIGSIRGALVGAILVGCIDTLGRTVLQQAFREFLPPQWASAAGPAFASVAVYVFMAVVLAIRPQGLFPARGG
jgi:branched-chain amino acid transport system permease protein